MNEYDPSLWNVPLDVLGCVPPHMARDDTVLPIRLEGDVLVLAVEDPSDSSLHDKLRFVCNRQIRLVAAARMPLVFAIWRQYGHPGRRGV